MEEEAGAMGGIGVSAQGGWPGAVVMGESGGGVAVSREHVGWQRLRRSHETPTGVSGRLLASVPYNKTGKQWLPSRPVSVGHPRQAHPRFPCAHPCVGGCGGGSDRSMVRPRPSAKSTRAAVQGRGDWDVGGSRRAVPPSRRALTESWSATGCVLKER